MILALLLATFPVEEAQEKRFQDELFRQFQEAIVGPPEGMVKRIRLLSAKEWVEYETALAAAQSRSIHEILSTLNGEVYQSLLIILTFLACREGGVEAFGHHYEIKVGV